jgi:4-hydroxymandelate oxidase
VTTSAAAGLPFWVKGVLRADDALLAVDAGAAGIVVSNHGGRQLDGAVATAVALPEVTAAVGGRAQVLVDGGVRSGRDVVTALALGADAVLLARPVLWALAVGGADGVRDLLTGLREEVVEVLRLCGAPGAASVGRDLLA